MNNKYHCNRFLQKFDFLQHIFEHNQVLFQFEFYLNLHSDGLVSLSVSRLRPPETRLGMELALNLPSRCVFQSYSRQGSEQSKLTKNASLGQCNKTKFRRDNLTTKDLPQLFARSNFGECYVFSEISNSCCMSGGSNVTCIHLLGIHIMYTYTIKPINNNQQTIY